MAQRTGISDFQALQTALAKLVALNDAVKDESAGSAVYRPVAQVLGG